MKRLLFVNWCVFILIISDIHSYAFAKDQSAPILEISRQQKQQSIFEKNKNEKLRLLGAARGDIDYYSTGYGYKLELSDGSTIQTTWAVTLCDSGAISCQSSSEIADSTLCEPAILALTRIFPDGRQIWEKSYLERASYKGKTTLCNPNSWWFSAYSRWVNFPFDLASSSLYLLKDGKTLVINPVGRPLLYIDTATGEFVGKVDSNITLMDGPSLLNLKLAIESKVALEIPYPDENSPEAMTERVNQTTSIQRRRIETFFKYFEEAVFSSKNNYH